MQNNFPNYTETRYFEIKIMQNNVPDYTENQIF